MHNWPGKLRARRPRQGQHGPIKRIVGDTPLRSFKDVAAEEHAKQVALLNAGDLVPTDAKAKALVTLVLADVRRRLKPR